MNKERIIQKIKNIDWWHTMDLGEYGKTDGVQKSIMNALSFPNKLDGWTVLDIGAVDGFYSFEAEKRGAEKILAVDSIAWRGGAFSSFHDKKFSKEGFNLARKLLNSKVEDLELDDFNEDLIVEKVGQHDLVLFLGILYHMKDPFRVIRNLASITKRLLIVETHTDANDTYAFKASNTPLMAFYPGDELNNDASNWWGPNISCVECMLSVAGFNQIEVKKANASGRVVMHARK